MPELQDNTKEESDLVSALPPIRTPRALCNCLSMTEGFPAGAADLIAGAAPLLQRARYASGHADAQLHAADVVMCRAVSLQQPERHQSNSEGAHIHPATSYRVSRSSARLDAFFSSFAAGLTAVQSPGPALQERRGPWPEDRPGPDGRPELHKCRPTPAVPSVPAWCRTQHLSDTFCSDPGSAWEHLFPSLLWVRIKLELKLI